MPESLRIPIAADVDVVTARQKGRELAAECGFASVDQVVIAAAISEIARNILTYARHGEVTLCRIVDGDRAGLAVEARDQGPGIPDIARAMQDGHSTSGALGVGLPGARRLMDEFELISKPGAGTTVLMKKWHRKNGRPD